jgi:hypothetical protein
MWLQEGLGSDFEILGCGIAWFVCEVTIPDFIEAYTEGISA